MRLRDLGALPLILGAACRLAASDPGPTQSTSTDGNRYSSPIPVDHPFPDNCYGADHGGSFLSLAYPFASRFGNSDHSRGQMVYSVAPFTPRRSEGVFGMDVWLEQQDGAGNWGPAALNGGTPDQGGAYQPVNTPNPGPSPSYVFTWTFDATRLPPNTNFRVFIYAYIYNQGGGSQGDFPIYSATGAVNTGAANDPPRIAWTPSSGVLNPAQVSAGQTYTISADAQDDNGNLIAVSINKNGQPFAYAGGGDGCSGNSQNPSADGAGSVRYDAWALDAAGAQSPTISWTVAIVGKSSQPAVGSADATLPFGEAFIPQFFGGAGTGGWQFCVSYYTNWDGGASSYAGTNLGSSPGDSPGAVWVPSWTPLSAGSYAFYVARDGGADYFSSNIAGPYALTVTPPPPPPPSATLSASPASGASPLTTTLSWTSSQASAVTVTGTGICASSLSGSQVATLADPGTYTFTLTASGPGGQTAQSAVVVVAAPQYTLSTSAVGNGSVTPGGTYPADAVVTVAAAPGTGAFFNGWTGGISSAANPLSVTMTGDLVVCANFAPMQSQTIFFDPPSTAALPGPSITLSATASSGLPVVFTLLGGPATLAGDLLTPTGIGAISIQASQGGNSLWLPAASATSLVTAEAARTIVRFRFDPNGRDARISGPSSGTSALWTDPGGLQAFPWPAFANPLPAPVSSANVVLPAVPSAVK